MNTQDAKRVLETALICASQPLTLRELRSLFARASVYWHATGLGEDPELHPERMEHFGIATVEAMSAGAVPVAIGVAGQLEVFDDGVEGFHFHDLDELLKVDADGWKAAIPQIEQHFAQFGDALPAALADQLRTLANSL